MYVFIFNCCFLRSKIIDPISENRFIGRCLRKSHTYLKHPDVRSCDEYYRKKDAKEISISYWRNFETIHIFGRINGIPHVLNSLAL